MPGRKTNARVTKGQRARQKSTKRPAAVAKTKARTGIGRAVAKGPPRGGHKASSRGAALTEGALRRESRTMASRSSLAKQHHSYAKRRGALQRTEAARKSARQAARVTGGAKRGGAKRGATARGRRRR